MLGRIAVYVLIALSSLGLSFLIVLRPDGGVRAGGGGPLDPSPGSGSAIPSEQAHLERSPSDSAGPPPDPPALPSSGAGPQVTSQPRPDPRAEALCPLGMLLVDGMTCGAASRTCSEVDGASLDICRTFEPSRCRGGVPLQFCVDRHEYPNLPGLLPATLVTFEGARSACDAEGKRLCGEMEWMFACEGPSGLAYGYGDERRAGTCNVERDPPGIQPSDLWEARDVSPALARVDGRTASGTNPACVSPFGLEDAIGNVEEWVRSDVPGVRAALRGGGFASKSATCRSVRVMESPGFRQVLTGFRCCRDPLVRPRATERDGLRDGPRTLPPVAP